MWPLEYYPAVEETPSRKTNPRQGRQPSQSARIILNETRSHTVCFFVVSVSVSDGSLSFPHEWAG